MDKTRGYIYSIIKSLQSRAVLLEIKTILIVVESAGFDQCLIEKRAKNYFK